MAVNDITVLAPITSFGENGTQRHNVAANASGQGTVAAGTYIPAFRPGELAIKALGAVTVTPLYTTSASGNTKPVVATDYIVGLVVGPKTSTETDTAAGIVDIMPIVPGAIYLINAKVAATFGVSSTPVQSTYDALVGKRVLLDLASGYAAGTYTILASDSATSGVVIAPLDVTKYPGKVAFQFRAGLSDLA